MTAAEPPRRKTVKDRLLACWRAVRSLISLIGMGFTVVKLIRELFRD
jgi:hypothetical protein